MELRDVIERQGRLFCVGCGAVAELPKERFGLDWPDAIAKLVDEGWRPRPGDRLGELCPRCADAP